MATSTSSTSNHVYQVAVIGGGFSGLAAALKLHKQGIKVIVLEARDRVGGRSYSPTLPFGPIVDFGAGYIGPTQNRLYRLADEFGIETYPVNNSGKNKLTVNGSTSEYVGDIPTLSPFLLLDLNNVVCQHYNLTADMPFDKPWEDERFRKFDNMTAAELVEPLCWNAEIRILFRRTLATLMCCEASEVSALYWLWMVRQGDGFQRLCQVTNGAQERKFKTGSQSVANAIAAHLGSAVRYNSPVQLVDSSDESVVRITCWDGSTVSAQRVIIAMAPTLYSTIRFEPQLPPLKVQLGQRMPMGSIIKTITYYKTAWWRERGFSGTLLDENGPIVFSLDDTKPDGSYPAIMGFMLANNCRTLLDKTKEQRKQLVIEQFHRTWKIDAALTPEYYEEQNWCEERYSGGCYLAGFPPQALTQFGRALREPVNRLHFAGTELATRWAGYMEGAVQSGERAAHEIETAIALENGTQPPAPFIEDEPATAAHPVISADPPAITFYLPGYPTAVISSVLLLCGIGFAAWQYFNNTSQ